MASKLIAACAALAALSFAVPASATVLYSTDFSTFTDGGLAGQGGWGGFTGNEGSLPTVQDTVTDNGEPAVDLGSKGTAYYLYGPITPTGPITVSMDIYYDSTDEIVFTLADISSVGTLDAGDSKDDVAAGVGFAGTSLRALPAVNIHGIGSISSYKWYNVSMTLDYKTQTYDIALDGQALASNIPFCGYETNSTTCTGAQSSQFEGIEVAQGNGLRSGAIYFGDVSISEVPEPTTWAMMLAGFALTGLALRRRPLAA